MVDIKSLAVLALGLTGLIEPVLAHPGQVHSKAQLKREALEAQSLARRAAVKLARCADSEKSQALKLRSAERRAAKIAAIRRKRNIKRSSTQTSEYDNGSHNETGLVETSDVWANTSCILQPEATIGPYWVEGELIRSDVRDDETGVDMTLELEFIDVNTCEPAGSGYYVDTWEASAEGEYSGIAASGLDTTFLRGIQITDDDGIVDFSTFVPGHYEGRAVHTHLMVHSNVTEYDNGTYTGGTVRFISQLFYETVLRDAVEATSPYSSNTQAITTNEDDSILNAVTDESYDPFLKYIYLGDDISDGIFAYHSIGIDTSADYTSAESAAAHYYETGGVASSSSNTGGSGGAPSGTNGTAPSGMSNMSGAMPSGTMAAGTAASAGTSSLTTVIQDATGTAASSTATSNSGAASKGGLLHSMGIFKSGHKASKATAAPSAGGYQSEASGSKGAQESGKSHETGAEQSMGAQESGKARESGKPSDLPSGAAPSGFITSVTAEGKEAAQQTTYPNCS